MTKFARYILLGALTAASLAVSAADTQLLKVTDIKIGRNGDNLAVSIDIDPQAVNPGRDREVIFTPVVRSASGSDSVVMPSIRVAGRNRYYSHVRNNDLAKGDKVWAAGSAELIQYRRDVPFMAWMERSQVVMRQAVGHCCDPIEPTAPAPLANLDYTEPVYEPHIHYVDLTGDESIERSAEGSAFIDFIVNRTEIRPGYRRNKVELDKIIESISLVKNDPDAVITRITIKGFASPEGSYSNNVRLAMGRTQALKEYVRERLDFDPAIMSTDYEPEDWAGLRRWVADCTLPHRDEILQIIDSDMEPDPKNAEIQRRYPSEYKLMLDSIYPALRHSDYTVKYRIRTYVDIEELKRVFASHPENLRPVDFQRIAATYPVGSADYENVYLKAVEIHKADIEANLNAANIALRHGDIAKATEYLNRAGDSPEATFTRATLAAVKGDLTRARALFDEAAKAGMDIAAAERDSIDTTLRRNTVEYLITPEKR